MCFSMSGYNLCCFLSTNPWFIRFEHNVCSEELNKSHNYFQMIFQSFAWIISLELISLSFLTLSPKMINFSVDAQKEKCLSVVVLIRWCLMLSQIPLAFLLSNYSDLWQVNNLNLLKWNSKNFKLHVQTTC